MTENVRSKPAETTHRIRGFSLYVCRLLVAFLLGFVPMWLKARKCSRDLSEAERQLNLARTQNALVSAIINARLGDYELARQAVSDFFTFLRAEIDRADDAALSPAQKEGIQRLFIQRDEIITLLARSDPAAVDLLSDLYGLYRNPSYHL
jgi:hypothetical protein